MGQRGMELHLVVIVLVAFEREVSGQFVDFVLKVLDFADELLFVPFELLILLLQSLHFSAHFLYQFAVFFVRNLTLFLVQLRLFFEMRLS